VCAAQRIGVPPPATQRRLLPPWTAVIRRLRPHPAGLARFIAEERIQELAGGCRHTLLREQRPDTMLGRP
jgi:hypothetical protein